MKIRLPKIRVPKVHLPQPATLSPVLIIAGLGVFTAFGATFGLRWALAAAAGTLLLLGVAAGN